MEWKKYKKYFKTKNRQTKLRSRILVDFKYYGPLDLFECFSKRSKRYQKVLFHIEKKLCHGIKVCMPWH